MDTRLTRLNTAHAAAQAAVAALSPSRDKIALGERLERLASKVSAFNKAAPPTAENIKGTVRAMPPEDRAHVLMKAAMRFPRSLNAWHERAR